MQDRVSESPKQPSAVELPLTLVRTAPGRFLLSGELDVAAAPLALDRLTDSDADVALDCSGLTFIDAAGLRMLLALHEQCDGRGAKLTIVEPSRCVRRLIELTGLDEVLHCTNGRGPA